VNRIKLARRTLLRGAGVALALPWLEAMGGGRLARAQSEAAPLRFLGFFCPNGFIRNGFHPTATGAGFPLPPTLAPLVNVAEDVTVLSGLGKRGSQAEPYRGATGHEYTCTFLTAGDIEGDGLSAGSVSIDQLIAEKIGASTTFPSIQAQSLETSAHMVGHRYIAWANATTPFDNEKDPAALFDRLFSGFVPPDDPDAQAAAERLKRLEASVLDYVTEDTERLKSRLGSSDKARLDQYLTGIHELETRLGASGNNLSCSQPEAPVGSEDVQQQVKNMIDVIAVALQCDLTRVVTYMLENGIGNYVFDFLGESGQHHETSHHGGDESMIASCLNVEHWEIQQFAYLLERMKAIPEGDGTLLDNSVVFLSSDVADGHGHTDFDLPVLVAGKGGGALKAGVHLDLLGKTQYNEDASVVPVGDLLATFLQLYGIEQDGVGPYSSGRFTDILA
jgi:hypothetical protein